MRASITGFVFALIGSSLAATAYAEPTFYDPDFPIAGFECYDCHVHPLGGGSCNMLPSTEHPRHPCLNPFGRTFRSTAGGYNASMGAADEDGDGFTNLNELQNARSAGFQQGAESVNCSMLDAATSAGTYVTCGTSNVQVRATFSSSPLNSYTFTFQCLNGSGPNPSSADQNWSDRCLNTNECAGNPCAPGTCTEIPLGPSWAAPGYTCGCAAGYANSGMGCVLVDECMAGTDDCVAIATCVDTAGTSAVYTCQCPGGYTGDGRTGAGTGCTAVNECASAPCGAAGTGGADGMGCTEIPLGSWMAPGYTCTCDVGYEFNGTTCVLTDECTAGLDDCAPAAICVDPSASRVGDYTCTCPSGYLGGGHGAGGCRDINECSMGLDDCAADATCTNIGGGFTCTCPMGFAGDGRTCTEIDECMDPVIAATCDRNSTCVNTRGSFQCRCNTGYSGDGRVACNDIDECMAGTSDCDPDAICTNTIGRWTCECGDGWLGDGLVCDDIDECLDPTIRSRCSSVAECRNLPGGWECACLPGYSGDGFTCEDIDECTLGTHGCDPNATCGNTLGGFTCTCRDFFRGSGFECNDIDECAESADDCGPTEVCVNQVGMAPTCDCMPGFFRNEEGECVSACGDGSVGPGEACDDGNTDDGDGCSVLCEVERGWACYEPTGMESVCTMTCGDGFVDPSEECDDGEANADAPDACRLDCTNPACGDGIVDTGEACDEGDGNDDTTVDGCRTSCAEAYCGDGVVDTGEMCDPGGLTPEMARPVACVHECGDVDAGPGMMPMDGGCGCRTVPAPGTPWALLSLAGLGLLVRHRRRR